MAQDLLITHTNIRLEKDKSGLIGLEGFTRRRFRNFRVKKHSCP